MILKRWLVSIPLSTICPPMVIVVYGHRCADNQKPDDMAVINTKRVYRIMRQNRAAA